MDNNITCMYVHIAEIFYLSSFSPFSLSRYINISSSHPGRLAGWLVLVALQLQRIRNTDTARKKYSNFILLCRIGLRNRRDAVGKKQARPGPGRHIPSHNNITLQLTTALLLIWYNLVDCMRKRGIIIIPVNRISSHHHSSSILF